MRKAKFKMKNKVFIGFFSSIGISALVGTTVVSCGINNVINYDFVSFDPSLTGNLAILGFKPTVQSLYNSQTVIPSYVSQLNVPTESGVQPATSNAETWLQRNPGIAYNFFDANYVKNYGFVNSILFSQKSSSSPSQDFVNNGTIPILESSSSDNKKQLTNTATAWDPDAQIKDLVNQLDAKVKNKDGSDIFENKDLKAQNIIDKLNQKITQFKTNLSTPSANLKLSFWGINYGPNFVPNAQSFSEYGPSIYFPGWLYSKDPNLSNSLNFWPAVPSDPSLKFGVFPNDGFNTVGWISGTGRYDAKLVQQGFANSSNYVFVEMPGALMDKINDPSIIEQIKSNFAPMVIGNETDKDKESKVFIVPQGFSLAPYNMLGIDNAINEIAKAILGNDEISKINAFDVSNLATLSLNNYAFVQEQK